MLCIEVISRKHKIVGEKVNRLKCTISLSGYTIDEFESRPYGLSITDVTRLTQAKVESLQKALTSNGIQVEIMRKEC